MLASQPSRMPACPHRPDTEPNTLKIGYYFPTQISFAPEVLKLAHGPLLMLS